MFAKMHEVKVIEQAQTEWAPPIVFAPKTDSTSRFYLGYKKLNEVTVRDSYPIPRREESIYYMGYVTILSTVDGNSGYWKVEIAKRNIEKIEFVSHHGLLKLIGILFGLKNASGTVQHAMDIILLVVHWQFALVYLNDTVMFLKKLEAHIKHVRHVLKLLCDANVTVELEENKSFCSTNNYLSHIIHPGQLMVLQHTIHATPDLKPPMNIRNYYRS